MDYQKAIEQNAKNENDVYHLPALPPAFHFSPLSFAFADAVAGVQQASALPVNGILCAKTLAAIFAPPKKKKKDNPKKTKAKEAPKKQPPEPSVS